MEAIAEQKANFKRILLDRDETRIKASTKDWQKAANRLNESLKVALPFLDMELDDNKKAELLKGGYEKAIEFLKPKFPFPDAEIEFNLNALGKKPESVQKALYSTPGWFTQTHLAVVNGEVVITDEGKDLIDESCCRYTKNAKQNEVYAMALELCKQLNKASEAGYIGNLDRSEVERGIRLVKWNSKENGFYPNPGYIQMLNEQGKVVR